MIVKKDITNYFPRSLLSTGVIWGKIVMTQVELELTVPVLRGRYCNHEAMLPSVANF